jgi:hypothetical protein
MKIKVGDTEKRCSCCKKHLPLPNFAKCAAAADGLQWRCKACAREARLLCRYGIDKAELKQRIADQGGCCLICLKALNIDSKATNVDHDHLTGEVRGILCQPCNAALGLFDEDTDRMRRAIAYLESYL